MIQLGSQTERFWVGTILDLDSNPFLNNGFGSESGFNSKPILSVPKLVSIEKSGSGFGTGST